jgi:hypothetical protein
MRIKHHRYAAAIPGPHSVGTDWATVPSRERHGKQSPTSREDHEMEDVVDLWSAWIDLGGEG